VNRRERVGRILDEGLLVEDALHSDRGFAFIVTLQIRLVPSEAEAPEACIEGRMLHKEQVEARILGQPLGLQGHHIVLRFGGEAVGDGNGSRGPLDCRAGELAA